MFVVQKMTSRHASDILNWVYDPPYDFYNLAFSNQALQELLGQSYRSVTNQYGELIGFFCTGEPAQVPIGHDFGAYPEGYLDIGIGMKPELTGRGNGFAFLSFILQDLQKQYPDIPFRLTVAAFNERAIKLYTKLGFREVSEFSRESATFIVMVKNF